MSRKEYANCLHARGFQIGTGKGREYSCRVCRKHYCLTDKGPCPFYRSKFMYKMAWIAGAGNENIQAPVPIGGGLEDTYAGRQATTKRTAH